MRCCGSVCKMANAIRLCHLLLTFFVLYVLLKNTHSELHHARHSWSPYFFLVISLLSISLVLYFLASLTNPGFLPKADPAIIFKTQSKTQSSTDPDDSLDSPSLELSLTPDSSKDTELLIDPQEGSSNKRYCRVCHMTQPMRSKHCYQCGRCVRRFDHHCPWLGNCVGERNHRFFWLFLGCETALLGWGIQIAWSAIFISGDTLDWLRVNLLVFLSLLLVFLGAIVTGLLFLYHSYLMLSGQTTWEQASRYRIPYLRDLESLSNPFDEGCCCNMARFVCPPHRDWEQVYIRRTRSRTKSSA